MLGFYLNLLIFSIGLLELAWGISACVREKDASEYRGFVMVFTAFSSMVCCGYGFMGLIPDVSKAFIPRFFGLWGCLGLILSEMAIIIYDMDFKPLTKLILVNIAPVFGFTDLFLHGRRGVNTYIRHDFYNSFELSDKRFILFHYIFLIVVGTILLVMSVRWYKRKKIKREKRFVAQIIASNLVLFLSVFPAIFPSLFFKNYPTITYSIAFSINFVIWMRALRQKMSFNMTLKNVSEGIFYKIDIPVIIISESGEISLFNPSAQKFLELDENADSLGIRDIFTITDVETLLLKAKAKKGEDYQLKLSVKANGKNCLLKCAVQQDYAGEPFCIIGTILPLEELD
ncbi:MAG: hypothetical protein K6E78_10640 [Treponema sp.]|nr:hypothetical protein [Treponema sp.]